MFEWDDANISHIARHDISPEEAEQVIKNNPLDLERQFRNCEERIAHLGETRKGRVLVVVVTTRNDLIRVVTAYPANREMRNIYSAQKDLEDGEDSRDP